MKAHKRAVSGLSQDERDVLSVVGKRAVDDNTEYSVASRETRFRDPAHANARERGQRMRTEIFGDVAKRYHFDTELSRELLYFFPARSASRPSPHPRKARRVGRGAQGARDQLPPPCARGAPRGRRRVR